MWEYDVRSLFYFKDGSEGISEVELNEHGEKGWELVQIHNDEIIFKRKVVESKPE